MRRPTSIANALLMRAGFLAVGMAISSAGPAAARVPGPEGAWDRDDGRGGIRIAHCGDALCGNIVWLQDVNGPGRIGERVLFDMKKTGADSWAGSAHNPEDGRDYAGTMTLDGNHLLTRGCALGGLICQSVPLTRAR